MTDGNTIKTDNAPRPVGAYPHAKKVGDLLFLSGIGPRPVDGGPAPGVTLDDSGDVISYDIEAQCHAVFANVRAVLESAGASWDDLVDITVYLTDIKRLFMPNIFHQMALAVQRLKSIDCQRQLRSN